jgi:hypothetical protein
MAVSPVLARLLQSHPGPQAPEPKLRTAFILNRELEEELEKAPEARSLERVRALLEEGAHPFGIRKIMRHSEPLYTAVLNHWWDAARLLVSCGVYMEAPDKSCYSKKWCSATRRMVAIGCAWEKGTPEDIEWVHRVLNQGVIAAPGATIDSYMPSILIEKFPHALLWLMKENIHLMPPAEWLLCLVFHASHHGMPDKEVLDLYLTLPCPSETHIARAWHWALLGEMPSPLIPFLEEHYSFDINADADGVPYAWTALVLRRLPVFSWMMAVPVVENGFRNWLRENPSALRDWLCKEGSASYENAARDIAGVQDLEVLKGLGLLPSLADMESWSGLTAGFCLRQFVREALMTPAILDWVDTHWQDALRVVWKDGEPTLLEELATAFEKGKLPFNGKVRLEQRWLQATMPEGASLAGTKATRL